MSGPDSPAASPESPAAYPNSSDGDTRWVAWSVRVYVVLAGLGLLYLLHRWQGQ